MTRLSVLCLWIDDSYKFFPQACYKEVISLEPEVKEVSDAGNDLIQKEGLHGDRKEDIVKDIRDIEDRYKHLKKSSDEEVKR